MIVRGISRAQQVFADYCFGAGFTLSLIVQATWYMHAVPKRVREIRDQMFIAMFGSLPLVLTTALFIGAIIAMQTGLELARFGQESLLGTVVSLTLTRGMGPLFTAIAVSGLIGSTIAAQIGTMKVSEEIDALEVMSINPVYYLVMPRLLALALAVPILTIYTDAVGILGGALVAKGRFRVDVILYLKNAKEALELKDIYGGLIKALVYGITIGSIACSQGIRAEHGAEGVGRATLRTVVISFIFLLIFDYLLTWMIYGS